MVCYLDDDYLSNNMSNAKVIHLVQSYSSCALIVDIYINSISDVEWNMILTKECLQSALSGIRYWMGDTGYDTTNIALAHKL
jgi:hypothetical protein